MSSKTEDPRGSPNLPVGEAINIATRSVHTKLNKLIILRLPLTLPPKADDASNYVQGLLHIAPIYITFESLWRTILDSSETEDGHIRNTQQGCPEPSDAHSTSNAADSKSRPVVSNRIHAVLSSLYIEGLARSDALKRDLMALTGWSTAELTAQFDERAAESPMLSSVLSHIKRSVTARPHVLLAYAWVLYMALFSGGRFIRASLEHVDASSPFWMPFEQESDAELKMPGGFPSSGLKRRGSEMPGERPLGFLRFDTPADGEDLKQLFKARVLALTTGGGAAAEEEAGQPRVTAEEREDVVREAQRIFELMLRVVGELDEICGTEYEYEGAAAT
ncbi:heme oxygenase-like protein [Hypoxylon sp. FL0543]|nr:heme oxygenase-like protein [Hypoxylon sp. FL0543]